MIQNLTAGDKVLFLPFNKVFDFGYYNSSSGKAIIYDEGSVDQKGYAVDVINLKHVSRPSGCATCGSRRRNAFGHLFHTNPNCIK